MAKVKFWKEAKSFMSESYLSQLYGNAHKRTKK